MQKERTQAAPIDSGDALSQVLQAIGGGSSQPPAAVPAKYDAMAMPRLKSIDATAVLVEVELAAIPPTEFTVHVDCKLTPPQSTVARRLAAHLDRRQACLRNGQRVLTPSAAIKWLLEAIEKELQATT